MKQRLIVRRKYGEKIDEIGEIWAPRLNSGLFKVPWHQTRAIIEQSGIDMIIRFPAWESGEGPIGGTSEDKEVQPHGLERQAAINNKAVPLSFLRNSFPRIAKAKRSRASMSSGGERTVEDVIDVSHPKRPKIGKPPGKQTSNRDMARSVRTSSRYRNSEKSRSGSSESSLESETTSDDEAQESEHETDSDVTEARRPKRPKA